MTQGQKDVLKTVCFEIVMFFGKLIILFPLGFVVVMVIGCAVWGERPWDWIVSLVVGTGYSLFAMYLLFGLPFWLYGRPRCTKFWKRVLVSALTAYCIAAMVCWDALGRGGYFGRGWDDEWGASRIATTLCAPLNLPTVGVLWMVMKSVKGNAG